VIRVAVNRLGISYFSTPDRGLEEVSHMRKQSIIVFTILACLAMFAATFAKAEAGGSPFRVPFDFIVRGQKLPAGEYTVERVNRGDPSVLIIRDTYGAKVLVFLTLPLEASILEDRSALVFHRCGDSYFLFQIWTAEDKKLRELPSNTSACTRHKRDAEAIIVRRTED
jgi:hypothetical protein